MCLLYLRGVIMQVNRLFHIVYILLDKKTVTAKELAEKFEVSVRTIYRDVDSLCSAGIPIFTSQGRGGGISILDHYILNKSLLSDEEQNEILLGLQSLKAAKYPDIKNLDDKLSNIFKKTNQNWIEVDFSRWSSSIEEKEKFDILKSALLNKNTLEFLYFNSIGEQTFREIEPLKLIFKDKAWYIIGFCLLKNQIRIFKVSRIHKLTKTEKNFSRDMPDNFEMLDNKYCKELDTDVILKISKELSYRVYDEFDPESISKDFDGNFIVKISYPEDEWLYGYILSFGTSAEVIEPQRMKEVLSDKISTMLEHYKK